MGNAPSQSQYTEPEWVLANRRRAECEQWLGNNVKTQEHCYNLNCEQIVYKDSCQAKEKLLSGGQWVGCKDGWYHAISACKKR